jgi:hypothetical protein
LPFVIGCRLPRLEIDAQRAEFGRTRCLRGVGINVHTRCDLESHKAGSDDRRLELCLSQSAGDSALPQVDIALGLVADRLLNENVTDLQAAARF